MSLASLLQEIQKNEVNALIDINKGPHETYGGRVGLKRAAVENIARAKREYRKQLMDSTVFIVVTGPAKDQFSDVATSESFGCFSADPDAFFKDMAARVDKSLYGRESTRNLFSIASKVLEDKAMELDIQSYPMLRFEEKYNIAVKNAEELVPVLRRAVVDQVGSELVGLNAIYSVVDYALTKKHSAEVAPVVLNTSDESFAVDLSKNLSRLTSKVFLVTAGEVKKSLLANKDYIHVKNISEKTVGQALSTIRSKL